MQLKDVANDIDEEILNSLFDFAYSFYCGL